jgi:hypothetical protein
VNELDLLHDFPGKEERMERSKGEEEGKMKGRVKNEVSE